MSKDLQDQIRQVLQGARHVLIVSHIRPDGDAIGSMLGLGLSLQEIGKQVDMVLPEGLPSSYRHMTGSERITRKHNGLHDVTIVVDCSDLPRTGGVLGERKPTLNIDHHITNLNFGEINFVLPEAAAASSILAEYMPQWGLPITLPVAEALLTGLVSDTLGFRTTNVTAHDLRLAAKLIETGANLPEIYHQALVRRSFEAARFWGFGLEKMQREGRLLWTTLTLEDRGKAGYSGNDDADLVNMLSTIDESDVTVIFVQQKEGRIKVSWRAEPGWDVSQIALEFGGGGHPAAAGAEIVGDLDTVVERVLNSTRLAMNGSAARNTDAKISTII